jgi:hypothetical protein
MHQCFPNTHVHFIVSSLCFVHLFLKVILRHAVDDRLDVLDLADGSSVWSAFIFLLLLLLLVALPDVAIL